MSNVDTQDEHAQLLFILLIYYEINIQLQYHKLTTNIFIPRDTKPTTQFS